jgi:hypothetical protein
VDGRKISMNNQNGRLNRIVWREKNLFTLLNNRALRETKKPEPQHLQRFFLNQHLLRFVRKQVGALLNFSARTIFPGLPLLLRWETGNKVF